MHLSLIWRLQQTPGKSKPARFPEATVLPNTISYSESKKIWTLQRVIWEDEHFIKSSKDKIEMDVSEIKREILPGGDVRLSSGDCTFLYQRPRSGVLLVTISGHDSGQFGTTTLD